MAKQPPKRTDHEQLLIDLLSRKMRRSRVLANMTHQDLAAKAGLNLRNVQAMQAAETNIRFTTLARLKRAMRIKSWDELLPDWDDVEVQTAHRRKKAKKKTVKKVAKKTVKKVARKAVKQATKKPPRKSAGGSKKRK